MVRNLNPHTRNPWDLVLNIFQEGMNFSYPCYYQMDVKSAFLNGLLQEKVFVEQPKGFRDPHFMDHVL